MSTPLYDGLVAELVGTAREGESALGALRDAVALHDAGPGQRCPGCDLVAPCPTTQLLQGELSLALARTQARRELVARAVSLASQAQPLGPQPVAAPSAQPPAAPAEDPGDDPGAPTPALPSVAELFATNPATERALDALLGGSWGTPRR